MIPAWRIARMRRDRLDVRRQARRSDLALPFELGIATAVFAVVVAALAVPVIVKVGTPYIAEAQHIPPPGQVISTFSKGGARIYDRNGNLLYQFVDPYAGLRRPVPLGRISPWLQKATIAVEDPTFYTNPGVNIRGLFRAAYENFAPWVHPGLLEGTGGSSITQQLAKNVYIPAAERAKRLISRKLKEIAISLELTRQYSKRQILGWYLNSISYGGIYVGAEAAAEGYFSKHAADLTLDEAALLAGLPQSPAAYDPVLHPAAALRRRSEVLQLMVEHGAITQAQADQANAQPIRLHKEQFDIKAPHFVFGPVLNELTARFGRDAVYNDGLKVTTSLDLRLETAGQQILQKVIAQHAAATNSRNGALMAIDPHTGEVLAYVGSRNYFDDAIQGRVDNITALNSPGSTLKPFTYITAFEQGWGTGTGIPDEPFTWFDPGSQKNFTPKDPARSMGVATAAEALGNSSNVAAVHTILFAGVPNVVDTLRKVGYTTFTNPAMYGPALTVGGTDVRLEDSVIAYTVLANQGVMRGERAWEHRPANQRQIDPVVLLDVKDSTGRDLYHFTQPVQQRVEPAAATYLVTSILSNGKNTCVTWWCGALLLTNGMPAAVKTGASQPYINSTATGDTWALGYTTQLVAGVWAGNSDNSPAHSLYSTTIAWPVWNDFMVAAHKILGVTGQPFQQPPGVVKREVCWPSGGLATPACPADHRYPSLFLASVKPAKDTWWHTGPGGLPELVVPPTFLGTSTAKLIGYVQKGLSGHQLMLADGVAAMSGTASIAYGTTSLVSPAQGATVHGAVAINGFAQTTHLQSYYLDVTGPEHLVLAVGLHPVAGVLATWDTTKVPNGSYLIRLVVQDSQRGTLIATARVTVRN